VGSSAAGGLRCGLCRGVHTDTLFKLVVVGRVVGVCMVLDGGGVGCVHDHRLLLGGVIHLGGGVIVWLVV
jgi:hypothetical protein